MRQGTVKRAQAKNPAARASGRRGHFEGDGDGRPG